MSTEGDLRVLAMPGRVLSFDGEIARRDHCCQVMNFYVNLQDQHFPDPFDNSDNLIFYSAKFDEYGLIIHDGSSSYVLIQHCPWCGKKLPESKRDLWFDTLETLGFDNPLQDEIPAEFETDAWWNRA